MRIQRSRQQYEDDPFNDAAPAAAKSAPAAAEPDTSDAAPEKFKQIFAAHPELHDAWRAAQEHRETQKIFPTAAHAREASERLAEFQRLDDLFFSNRPESHAQLAALVEKLDPQAFHNLAQAMAERSREARRGQMQVPEENQPAQRQPNKEAGDVFSSASSPSAPSSPASAFHGANAAAVQGVVDAIEQQVSRLLPEEIPAGARNRVVAEIYREVQTSLASDRALAEQLRQAFQSGSGDEDHQQAVAGILVNRARKILPGLARRVIEEWTSSVLAASHARRTRQEAGARRVDISSGAPGGDRRRSYSPRDIDYARTSDSDILNL